jgi:methylmalonyl-CoA/ethylmalonyl-CoA epimerase
LLAPFKPDTGVARFLARRGPGLHHAGYAVPDLDAALEQCRAQGIDLIDEAPRCGAGGLRVAFLHPRSTGRVLIELVESADDCAPPHLTQGL